MIKILLLRVHSILNAGDHAILRTTLQMVERAFPGARVTIAFQDPASASMLYGEEQVVGGMLSWIMRVGPGGQQILDRRRWIWYTLLVLLSVCCSRLLRRPCILFWDPEKRRLLRAYMEADLVLASGGGYLYSTKKYSPWFIGLVLELALAIWLGKPLILLPQSIGPISGTAQRWLVCWLVRRARLVLVREDRSCELLEELGANGAILRFPDLAFSQRAAPRAEAHAWLKGQGGSLSNGRWRVGLTVLNWSAQYRSFCDQDAYEQAIVELCDHLIARGAQIVCLPQCCGPTAAQDDRMVAFRIRNRLQQPDACLVPLDQPSPEVLQTVCGDLDLFVGTRMHSVIFALNAGVPPVIIGYLHKSRGILTWLGWEDWCEDIASVTGPSLLDKVEQLRAERDTRLPQLCQQVKALRRLSDSLPGLLRSTWLALDRW